eukprot:14039769-Alexandrium_andersonii.AAC.1
MLALPRPAGIGPRLPPKQSPRLGGLCVGQKTISQPEAPAVDSCKHRGTMVMSLEFHMEKAPGREA